MLLLDPHRIGKPALFRAASPFLIPHSQWLAVPKKTFQILFYQSMTLCQAKIRSQSSFTFSYSLQSAGESFADDSDVRLSENFSVVEIDFANFDPARGAGTPTHFPIANVVIRLARPLEQKHRGPEPRCLEAIRWPIHLFPPASAVCLIWPQEPSKGAMHPSELF